MLGGLMDALLQPEKKRTGLTPLPATPQNAKTTMKSPEIVQPA
jgi:hypothetical protein